MNLEICASNLSSAIVAAQAGAQRIELCSALDVGGLSPSFGLIQAVVQAIDIPVHVLIRSREGDFYYGEDEIALMCADIRTCRSLGVAGVVVGALTQDSALDLEALRRMQVAGEGLDFTCHRAIDFVPDVLEALDQLVALGFVRVLSSGQAPSAFEGRFLLQKMVQHARGRITVMPGAGITPENIAEIKSVTGASDFHATAKTRAAGQQAHNSIPGLDSGYWMSDLEKILRAKDVL